MKAMCETGPTVYSILILIREVLPFADAITSTALLRSYKTMSVVPAGNLISSSLTYCMLLRINEVRVFLWHSWISEYNHEQVSFRTLVP